MKKIFILICAVFLTGHLSLAHSKNVDKPIKKVVLIVGASRGMGLETANYLADHGYKVYGTSRKAKESTEKITFYPLNLAKESDVSDVINKIIHTEGHLDVVINNAAMGLYGPAEEVSISQAQHLFDINVFGVMRVMQAVLPQFRKQGGGLLINVSSMAAMGPVPASDWYAASKFALEGLSESMATYLDKDNIRLVILEPGPVKTQFITHTSELGNRSLPNKPYGSMGQKVFEWHKELLAKGQNPHEVAELIYKIIQTPEPSLRYQTSSAMQELAKQRYVDPTGNQYVKEKRELLKTIMN